MNVFELIETLNDGYYFSLEYMSEKRKLTGNNIAKLYDIIIPEECISDWPEPRNATKEQINIIIKVLLNGISILRNNIENCTKLSSLNWPKMKNIIQTIMFKQNIDSLDDLLFALNANVKFNNENILKYTNKEIYEFLQNKINNKTIYKFLIRLKRNNPTVENTFTLNDKSSEIIKRYNEKYDNIVDKLDSALDGKNAILSGGSVCDAILNKFNEGRDIDIFCNTTGFKICFEKLKNYYKKIVYFIQYNSCVNLIIPYIDIIIQFIITDYPLVWIMGNIERQGFDFEHLKSIIVNKKLYNSYNSLYCFTTGKTYISADLIGCPQPHRLVKAMGKMPIDIDESTMEYCGQLIDKYILRNEKYLFIRDESPHRIEFLIRKIYNLSYKDNVYIVDNDNTMSPKAFSKNISNSTQKSTRTFTLIINNACLVMKKSEEVEFENIKNMEFSDNSMLERATLSGSVIGDSVRSSNYSRVNDLFRTPRYNGAGLIPPVIVIGNKTLKDEEYIIVEPFLPGKIIGNIFGEYKYMIFINKGKFIKGNVLYCILKNKPKNEKHIYINNEVYECLLADVDKVFRYRDLETVN